MIRLLLELQVFITVSLLHSPCLVQSRLIVLSATETYCKTILSATETYCEIAIAESNKRRREHPHSNKYNVIDAFRSRMRDAVQARKELAAAARAVDEARAEVGGVGGDSDDDTAPPNGLDDILN